MCVCIDVLSIDYVRLNCIFVALHTGQANYGSATAAAAAQVASCNCAVAVGQPAAANWQPHRACNDESVEVQRFVAKQNALECGKVSDRLQIGIAIKSDHPQRQRAPMWHAAGSKWHVASGMLYVLTCLCVCRNCVCCQLAASLFN